MQGIDVIAALADLGTIGLLLAAIYLGVTGKVVPRSLIKPLVKEAVAAVIQELRDQQAFGPPKDEINRG